MRTCKVCGVSKSMDDFQYCYVNKQGLSVYSRTCIRCTRSKDSVRAKTSYNSIRGKAVQLLKGARRNNKAGADFELDLDFVVQKLNTGVCEVTGIPFNYTPSSEKYKTNKYAPSLDRVNNNVGYTKDNVRVVIWWYNLMKNDETDEATLAFCQAVVNNLNK